MPFISMNFPIRFFIKPCRQAWLVLTAAIGLAALLTTPSQAALPGKTKAVLKIHSLDSLTGNWQAYMQRASKIEFNIDLERYLSKGFDLQSLEGVDRARPLWAVYSAFEDGEEPVVAFYPLIDEAAFRRQLPEDEVVVTINKSYALVSAHDHARAWHEWFEMDGSIDALNEILPESKSEIQLWGNLDHLFADYKKMVRDVLSDPMPGEAGRGQTSPWRTALQQSLFDLTAQAESALLQVDLSPEAIVFQKVLQPRQNSDLQKFLQNFHAPDTTGVLPAFTADALIFGLWNVNPQNAESVLTPFWQALQAFEGEPLRSAAQEAASGALAVSVELTNQLDAPLRLYAVQETAGQEAGKKLGQAWRQTVKAITEASGTGHRVRLDPEPQTSHDDHGYNSGKENTIVFEYAPENPEVEVPESWLGNNQTLTQAAIGQYLFTTNGRIKTIEQRIRQETWRQWEQFAPDRVTDHTLFAVRLNLVEVLRAAQMYLAKNSPDFNPLLAIKIPNVESQGVWAQAQAESGSLIGRLAVPSEELNTLIRVITADYPIDTKSRSSKPRNR